MASDLLQVSYRNETGPRLLSGRLMRSASQHPIGRRQASQASTSHLLHQCGAHRRTPQRSFTILPPLSSREPLRPILFSQEHMKVPPPSLICRAGDIIDIKVSKTTSQVRGGQTIHQMTNNIIHECI